MGEHKHRVKSKEAKVIKAKREDEQHPSKKPAEVVSRLSANVAQPQDVQALQRTLGNKVVANMIQRATSEDLIRAGKDPVTGRSLKEDKPKGYTLAEEDKTAYSKITITVPKGRKK